MNRRVSAGILWAIMLTCCSAALSSHPAAAQQSAVAQESAQAPDKSATEQQSAASLPQPAAEKQESNSKYTPEQQHQLDRARDLLAQVNKLNNQGKYADAIPLAANALKLREAVLPAEDLDIANACSALGYTQQQAGNLAEALPLFQRALKIREKALDSDHPQVATSLNNLAQLYQSQGNYPEALSLFQRALKIREKTLGPDHVLVANTCNNLAALYYVQGNYGEVLPLYQRALKIYEKALGPDHPYVATACNNLALLYKQKGNYTEAIPLLQRAIKIGEKSLGPDHPDLATWLTSLALLYKLQGNYAEALPLYQRSLTILEKTLGPDHPNVATVCNNLAMLYQAQGNYTKAQPLYERSLKIREKALGPDHSDVAQSLNNLAFLYKQQGNYADALPLIQRAITIDEKALGPDHPEVATNLKNLAMLYQAQGNYAQALSLFQRSLKIEEITLGPDNPDAADSCNDLALLYDDMGENAQAEPFSHRALTILRGQLERIAVIQSERQQLRVAQTVRFYLDNYLSVAQRAAVPAEQVYAEVLAWKGSVSARQQAMRQLRANLNDPKVAASYSQLTDTARQLDNLSRATPKPEEADVYKQELAELNKKLETLQQQLAAASADYRQQLEEQNLTPAILQRALPADTVLVDLLEYWHYEPPKEKGAKETCERRLAAFVVRSDAAPAPRHGESLAEPQPSPEERESSVVWVELGPSKPITDLVDRWRRSYSTADGAELRRLVWQPLEDKLAGATTVLVSPDGALDRFPLAALPGKQDGTYLIEDLAIATVPIPRLLPELLNTTPSAAMKKDKPAAQPSLLTVGEVDFKAALLSKDQNEQLAMRAPVNQQGGRWQFPPLDGTRDEILAINDSFEERFPDAPHKSLRKGLATKQAVCDAMPRYAYLHLATHGFFAPPEIKSALENNGTGADKRSLPNPDVRSGALDVAGYHPDLLCGLALAGANQQAEPGQDDGILTALAVEELDLNRVQLATLSACETGLGQTAGGEGVLGLQRAFQLAGARSTLATLWKINDHASQVLMSDFYRNLWDPNQHLSKLEALRQAQLKLLREGAGRGLEMEDHPAEDHHRMPPFYWAAFQLSGDWR